MAEYIERETVIKAVKHAWAKGLEPTQYIDIIPAADVVSSKTLNQVMWERDLAIEQLESYGVGLGQKADVAPVVHGKWIPVEAYGIGNTAKCSECEKRQYGYDGFKFCPNCGAKMDGD